MWPREVVETKQRGIAGRVCEGGYVREARVSSSNFAFTIERVLNMSLYSGVLTVVFGLHGPIVEFGSSM